MTATVTQFVIDSLPRTPGLALTVPIDGIVAGVLLILLVARLLLQAADTRAARRAYQTLDIAAIPLLIAFVIIVYTRIQEIMPLG
jgi:hypothetical protein